MMFIYSLLGILGFLLVLISFFTIIISGIIFLIKKYKDSPRHKSKKTLLVSSCTLILGIIFFAIAVSHDNSESESAKPASTTEEHHKEKAKKLPKVKLSTDKTTYETNANSVATIKGNTEPGATVSLFDEDLNEKNVKVNPDGSFTVDVNKAGDYDVSASKDGRDDKSITVTVKYSQAAIEHQKQLAAAKKQAEIDEGKKNAQTITYNHLKKNADDYIGTKYFITGKVAQAIEDDGKTLLRVDITNEGYGIYDDTVAVLIDGKTDAVEDDIVQVFGEITGNFTYTSTINAEITIPGMQAKPEDVKVIGRSN